MFGNEGVVKLVDFGLAKRGTGIGATFYAPYCGCTPGFDSPQVREAQHGEPLAVRDHDLFAWACSAFDMLTVSDSAKSVATGAKFRMSKLQLAPPPPERDWDWPRVEAWARAIHPDVVGALEQNGVHSGAALLALPPTMDEAKRLGMQKVAVRKKLQAALLLAPSPALRAVLVKCFDEDRDARPTSLAGVLDALEVHAERGRSADPAESSGERSSSPTPSVLSPMVRLVRQQ